LIYSLLVNIARQSNYQISLNLSTIMKKITNPLFTLLFVLLIGTVYGQTKKPATKPASKPASTTPSTKPYTPPATKPAAPKPTPATEQEDMQAQYDKLNGNATKPASPATTTKPKTADKPYVRPSAGSSGSRVADSPKPAKVAASKSKSSSSSDDDSKFHIGVRGGVNLMTIAKANSFQEAGTTSGTGFHGGLVLNLGGKMLSVQPEILFSQIGIKFIDNSTGGSSNSLSATINTVTVPLLLKLSVGGDNFRFFVTGGGFGSYLLSGTSTATIAGQKTSETIKFETDDRRIEYGATGGAGVQIGLGKMKLNLEGRYNYGLGGNEKVKDDAYSRTIMASVGVLIPL
jgi:Outer membrane protein beta-barrel domain